MPYTTPDKDTLLIIVCVVVLTDFRRYCHQILILPLPTPRSSSCLFCMNTVTYELMAAVWFVYVCVECVHVSGVCSVCACVECVCSV